MHSIFSDYCFFRIEELRLHCSGVFTWIYVCAFFFLASIKIFQGIQYVRGWNHIVAPNVYLKNEQQIFRMAFVLRASVYVCSCTSNYGEWIAWRLYVTPSSSSSGFFSFCIFYPVSYSRVHKGYTYEYIPHTHTRRKYYELYALYSLSLAYFSPHCWPLFCLIIHFTRMKN